LFITGLVDAEEAAGTLTSSSLSSLSDEEEEDDEEDDCDLFFAFSASLFCCLIMRWFSLSVLSTILLIT
jgi:hypothetical protein